MTKFTSTMTSGAIALVLSLAPAFAKPSDEDVAGALVLLGIGALAHNEHHYREGYSPAGAEGTAGFELGYRDAVHGYPFDGRGSDYEQGYGAGIAERNNSSSHRHQAQRIESDGPNVPAQAMQGCAKVVATNFNVNPHHVHITRTVQRGPNDYLVEAAVGHKYMTCAMGDGGNVVDVVGGRMQ